MGRDWKQWAADKGLKKWFRRDNLLILVLTGILLVIIALPTKEEQGEKNGSNAKTDSQTQNYGQSNGQSNGQSSRQDSQNASSLAADAGAEEDALYAARMEERLTRALSRIEGVGEVQVMITLKSSSELVVEKEQPVRRSSTNESDAAGGNRAVGEVTSEENVVYRTEGSLSEPYVVKTLPPQIEGVLVIARGAGNGTVSRTIVEIAQALFGVEAHKVKVVRMEETAPSDPQ